MLMFCTFLGFVGLWYKNDEPGIDTPAELEPRKDSPQDSVNHIQDPEKAKFQGRTDKPDHLPGPILEVSNRIEHGEAARIPAPVMPNIQPPKPPNLPSPQDAEERMRAEMWFLEDERKVVRGLGEGGKLVKLSGEEAKLAEEVQKKEAFNLILSDKISVNRTVPDSRDPLCKTLHYDQDLPTASVIIIFTNEAWSPLIRTIWSVINRSPPRFLKEIVLVDDFSDRAELGEKLDLYLKYRLPPLVKMVRLKERHGLIRARLAGAREAVGDVLIFLDSHCEANDMWMEPLLQRIKESRSAVLVPIIDVIDDHSGVLPRQWAILPGGWIHLEWSLHLD